MMQRLPMATASAGKSCQRARLMKSTTAPVARDLISHMIPVSNE